MAQITTTISYLLIATLGTTNSLSLRGFSRDQNIQDEFRQANFKSVDEMESEADKGTSAYGKLVKEILQKEAQESNFKPNFGAEQRAELIRFFNLGNNVSVHVFKGKPMGKIVNPNKSRTIKNPSPYISTYGPPVAFTAPRKQNSLAGNRHKSPSSTRTSSPSVIESVNKLMSLLSQLQSKYNNDYDYSEDDFRMLNRQKLTGSNRKPVNSRTPKRTNGRGGSRERDSDRDIDDSLGNRGRDSNLYYEDSIGTDQDRSRSRNNNRTRSSSYSSVGRYNSRERVSSRNLDDSFGLDQDRSPTRDHSRASNPSGGRNNSRDRESGRDNSRYRDDSSNYSDSLGSISGIKSSPSGSREVDENRSSLTRQLKRMTYGKPLDISPYLQPAQQQPAPQNISPWLSPPSPFGLSYYAI